MPLSDSSGTYPQVVRPQPLPARPSRDGGPRGLPVLVSEASQACQGSTTTQGRPGTRAIAPVRVAFRLAKDVGTLMARFRSSIPCPPAPLFTLHGLPRGTPR